MNHKVLTKTIFVATRMRSLVLIELSFLLSLPEGLHVERIEPQGALLTIAVVSVRPSSCCPLCALSVYHRSTAGIGGPYVMSLVEVVRSSFIS